MFSTFSEDSFAQSGQEILAGLKTARIASGQELTDLSMINPDIPPARILIDKLLEASVKSSNHRYSVSKGIKRLRTGFAEKYESAFGVSIDPEKHVCVTMGSKDGIVNTLLAYFSGGANVLLPAPTYPAHLSAVRIAGLNPLYYNIGKTEDEILSDIQQQVNSNNVKAIILNFPNNPSGKSVSPDFYVNLAERLKGRDVLLLNDFVYGEMSYDGKAQPSLLSIMGKQTPVLESYSLSKAYSIPGWRVGAMLGSSELISKLSRIKSHIDYGIFLPLQIAACSALQSPQIAADTTEKYRKRFKMLSSNLRKLGWYVEEASAGAALWCRLPGEVLRDFGSTDSFCIELLKSKGILLSPGGVFGAGSEDCLRMALVCSEERLFNVTREISDFLSSASGSVARKQNVA